ncbi:MAG TPA: hypothetical protein VGL22_10750 [Terracidiphilus sp.]
MRRSGLVAAWAALALVVFGAGAQDAARRSSRDGAGVEVLAVTGKPFSATSVTEWVRDLEDGDKGALHLRAKVARDSKGRVYRERYAALPSANDNKLVPNEIHIMDPVSRSQTFCSTRAMECVVTDYQPKTSVEAPKTGTEDNGVRTFKRELIGSQMIEGLRVSGTRETTTLKTAILGNGTPFVSVREFWYSDDLMTNLSVTRIDPREGRQVIRLSQIVQAEPDAHLFDLPVGYKVRDVRRKDAATQ